MNKIDCTFPRAEMAAALGRLASVLPTRTTLPVLNFVRVSHDGDRLRLEATDLDRRAEASVPLSAGEPFDPVCLPLNTFLSFAKSYTGVSGQLVASGDMVVFSSGASKVKLPTLPSKEFPELNLSEGVTFGSVGGGSGSALRSALLSVLYAVGTEMAKPAMLGVCLSQNGKGLACTATNGHRMGRAYASEWETNLHTLTVATGGIQSLLRFFPTSESLRVEIAGEWLRFASDSEGSLIVPTLDTPFPNVEQIIPRDSEITVRITRAALISAVKRAALVLEADIKDGLRRLVFSFSAFGLDISASGDAGEASEHVPADVTGPDLRIGFNAPYVLEMLNSMEGETVVAEMKAPERATLWRSETGDGLHLLMPLRLL